MTTTELRFWRSLEYFDPVETLLAYQQAELRLSQAAVDRRIARLRTSNLKPAREGRDAALFAHGMSAYLGTRVLFSPTERDDYDFVTCVEHDGTNYFTPVQLKELVPADLNPSTSLNALLESLRERKVFSNTALAIRLNREQKGFDLATENFGGLPFKEVWLFWASSPDGMQWRLVGDCLSLPRMAEFSYPVDGAA